MLTSVYTWLQEGEEKVHLDTELRSSLTLSPLLSFTENFHFRGLSRTLLGVVTFFFFLTSLALSLLILHSLEVVHMETAEKIGDR